MADNREDTSVKTKLALFERHGTIMTNPNQRKKDINADNSATIPVERVKPIVKTKPVIKKTENTDSVIPKVAMRDSKKTEKINRDSLIFNEPMELVYVDEKDKQIHCNEKTISELSKIDHPLNVVAVTGLYRSGKSYLLNRLAGQSSVTKFAIGHESRAKTKGIWIWCMPHPTQEGQVLMLLDTEGFGDAKKNNSEEDAWYFTLATILSSTLIYNHKGEFDVYAIKRMRFLQNIQSNVKIHGDKSDELLIDFFFPVFVLALRDYGLDITDECGNPITPDQHLENCLMVDKEIDVEHAYNKNRLLVRKYFKKRKCFTFAHPCQNSDLKKINTLTEEKLDKDFVRALEEFTAFIYSRQPNTLQSGRTINGRMFGNLTLHYTNSIRENETTSLLEAARSMAETENQYAVKAASDIYKKEMQRRTADINPNESTLVDFHNECMQIAVDFFKHAIVFDDQEIFYDRMMESFTTLFATFKRVCEHNSEDTCRRVLERLDLRISKKMKNQAYRHPAGYDEYITDIDWIVKQYRGTTGLGPRSRAVIQEFIDEKVVQEEEVHKLVSEAQQEKTDNSIPTSQPNQSSRNMKAAISRSYSYQDKLTEADNAIETQLKDEINKVHANGIEVIRQKCDDNLQLKIKETERQMQERSDDTDTLNELKAEVTRLNALLEETRRAVKDGQESSGKSDEDTASVYNLPWDRNFLNFALDTESIVDQMQQQHKEGKIAKHGKSCKIL